MQTITVERNTRMYNILLVEDNPGDIVLVQEAIKEGKYQVNLDVVRDGAEAMVYLEQNGLPGNPGRPDLIILDINLPKTNGLDILQEIKQDPSLKDISVVVFTTSRSNKDILRTYGLGGVCLITKPLGFYEYMESIKSMIAHLLPQK